MNVVYKNLLFLVMFKFSTGTYGTNIKMEGEEIIQDISSMFRNYYAPREWKLKHFSWDLDVELSKLESSCSLANNIQSFHASLKDFFQSSRDYHTSILFAHNGMSSLPISIKYIQGKFYVSYVAQSYASSMLQPGDQIIKIGDKDVESIALALIGNIENPSLTDWALASKKLTLRLGVFGDCLEKGSVIVQAKRKNENIFAQLVWNYDENQVSSEQGSLNSSFKYNQQIESKIPKKTKKLLQAMTTNLSGLSYQLKLFDFLQQDSTQQANNPMSLGERESYLPKLGDVIVWQAQEENPWDAYVYLNEDKKLIGFIRIPSYSPDEKLGDTNFFVEKFGETLNKMNEMTDMLVIDQLNNPGGNILYLYALASIITKEPLKTPHHRFTIDSKDVWDAHDSLKKLDLLIKIFELLGVKELGSMYGYPADIQFFFHMKSYFQFIIQQWEEGKTLTDPHFLYGVDYIRPNPNYGYSKPILLLINELDFSGGDFFPEIAQQNKKVTLMGTNTAGAGGYVLSKVERNRAGVIGYSYTSSLAFKADGYPLENLGIAPHIEYIVSPLDLQTGFLPFKNEINKTIKSILK